MPLTFMDRKTEKQLQHSRTESSRKQREKTVRQRPGERKRRRREMTGASAPSFPGPQGRQAFTAAEKPAPVLRAGIALAVRAMSDFR